MMNDIIPVSQPNMAGDVVGAGPNQRRNTPESVTDRSVDSVQLSEAAKLLIRMAEMPEVRQDLINHIRAQIHAGTYETDDKIDAILDELAQDLT